MESVNSSSLGALFVECNPPPEDSQSFNLSMVAEELQGSHFEVYVLKQPSLDELRRKLVTMRPCLIYCSGGFAPHGDILNARQLPLSFPDETVRDSPSGDNLPDGLPSVFKDLYIQTIFLDAPLTQKQVAEMKAINCFQNLVFWPVEEGICSAAANQFSHCFFAMMRNPTVVFSEAFSLASRSVQLHCDNILRERPHLQLLPSYVTPIEPDLPHCNSIPLDPVPGISFIDDVPEVEGWENVLLLAPKAEARLMICGGPSVIDATRLAFLGEALRALLLTEMRSLTVSNVSRCDQVPSNIASNSAAVRCIIRSLSGIETVVVLGGPPSILSNTHLVQHALRQTLAVDSLCLQFRLPPPTLPVTTARSSAEMAGGTPIVDALVVTSVWTVHVLRGLAKDKAYRGLVSLGIAGVGGDGFVDFKLTDTLRYNTLVTGMQNRPLSPRPVFKKDSSGDSFVRSYSKTDQQYVEMELDTADSMDNDSDYDVEMDPDYEGTSKTSADRMIVSVPDVTSMNYHSTRPPLSRCTESEFYEDLVSFLEAHRGKSIDRERFPEAVLNGTQLDLFNLYKEVVSRGGFRVGNGINWKGQVFPKMRNWTANHRMTGVGNALKRHYQAYLCEYEMVHTKDLTGDGCWLCGSNDESGTDWICCDHCERWIHFACDRRPFLGTFKDYATGDGGRTYHCPRCSDLLKKA